MTNLVLAEHNNQNLNPATNAVVTAAKKIGGDITILIAGQNCQPVADQAAAINGVNKVILIDAPEYQNPVAENIIPLLQKYADGHTHILAPATTFGKNIMPRFAAMIDSQQISDIIEVIDDKTFKRPIYAGNAIATVQSSDAIKIITVRSTNFDKAGTGGTATIEKQAGHGDQALTQFIELQSTPSDKPDLQTARVIVSGGRGLQNAENFKLLDDLAVKLHAAVGATRAVVDAGFVPNDMQVGQTGKIVAPELYIAVGISGAIQHIAGMKDSKVIVAINKDPDAPIFAVADYGLVADLFDAVPELTGKLS